MSGPKTSSYELERQRRLRLEEEARIKAENTYFKELRHVKIKPGVP